ncbi:DNA methylase [Streptococcus pneumoniae]|nr:DNA methylase [Streptococcus pneumoniae]
MTQTLEEGMKNQSKCIKIPMEIRPFDVCIGFCEIDKFARASYKAIHDTKGEIELHDITTVSDDTIRGIGHVDVICGGFPCQAFSILNSY